jgi:hypothetical protein
VRLGGISPFIFGKIAGKPHVNLDDNFSMIHHATASPEKPASCLRLKNCLSLDLNRSTAPSQNLLFPAIA